MRKFFVTLKVLQQRYMEYLLQRLSIFRAIFNNTSRTKYLRFINDSLHTKHNYKPNVNHLIILTINLSLLCKINFSDVIKYIATNNENVITKNTKYVIYRLKGNYSILTLEAFTITTL